MKKWKQALALVLALVMALSLVALPSFAADEETGGGTAATQPVWPAEGSINLSKKAQPVDEESGLYEVTLGIQGKNYKTTSDVVLVIDNSNSMYTEHSNYYEYWYEYDESCRMYATKQAAQAFAEKLLTEDSSTRIALVVYGTNVRSTTDFYDKNTKADLISKIDAIGPESDTSNGATNQQAGIHKAQQLLTSEASTGKQKNIVILSDGAATKSHPFIVPKNGSAPATPAPDYTKVIGSGSKFEIGYYGVLVGPTKWYDQGNAGYYSGSSYKDKGSYTYNADGTFTFKSNVNTNNGIATIWEANQAKAAGTTIFSVALQAGTEGENTLKSCASDAAKGYFAIANNDNVETKLTAAFETIAGSIAKAATNGSVTDPMSQHVNLAFTGDPKVTSSLDEYNAGGYDVYLSQGTVTRNGETLNWNVGDINEGTPAVMKYRVTLKDGLNKDRTYPTNDTTTFNYTDYQDRETSKDFEIPQVAPKGGTILMHFYLVNAQGQPINEKGVEVESPDKAKQLAAQEYYQMNGSQALEYDTYNVPMKEISGAAYYGYTLDGVTTKDVTEASVTVSTTNANREVWFA